MINRNIIFSSIALALVSCTGQVLADASSPWTPADESSELTLRLGTQSATEFYAGKAEMKLPAKLSQDTYTLEYSYGINDHLALDARIGYTKSKFITVPGLAPNGGLSGFADSRLGLRYNLTGADNDLPTITFGLAALIKGNYDTGALPAVGDGKSGFEVSALIGHAFDSGFLLSGGVASRQYSSPVPDELAITLGAGFAFNERASVGAFYQDVTSNGKLDIGGPGFSPARFPEVDEEFSLWGVGGSVSLTDEWLLGLDFGRKNTGKNTAKSKFSSLSITYLF
jgi:hypothetical protein